MAAQTREPETLRYRNAMQAQLRTVFLLYTSHQSLQILRAIADHPDVVPVAIVSSAVVDPRRGRVELLRFLTARERRWFVRRKAFEVVAGRLAAVLAQCRSGGGASVRSLAEQHHIELLACTDVNDPEFIERLRGLQADLFVSIHFNHIFTPSAIDAARMGTINVHGALLPRHRGLFPHLYALRDGDSESGVTVHWVDRGIDTGRPITAGSFPIGPADTVLSVENRAAELSVDLLAQALTIIRHAGPAHPAHPAHLAHPGDPGSDDDERPGPASSVAVVRGTGRGQYHSWPTRADHRALRARGRRYFAVRDLVDMFRRPGAQPAKQVSSER